jgi:hypothetical protein
MPSCSEKIRQFGLGTVREEADAIRRVLEKNARAGRPG